MSSITNHVEHYLANCINNMVPGDPDKVFVSKVLGSHLAASFRSWRNRHPAFDQLFRRVEHRGHEQYVATPVDLLKVYLGKSLAGKRAGFTKEIVDEILARLGAAPPIAVADEDVEMGTGEDGDQQMEEVADQESEVVTHELEVEQPSTAVIPAPGQAVATTSEMEMRVSPVVLNEQQLHNVIKDQQFSDLINKAVREASAPQGMIIVTKGIAAVFGWDMGRAKSKFDDWKAYDTDNIFSKAGVPGVSHEVTVCTVDNFVRFLAKTPEARRRGLVDHLTNTQIRVSAGDESLIPELAVNAEATRDTPMAELGRSTEVGSSSATGPVVQAPKRPRQYIQHDLQAFFYLAPGKDFIKIGETTNLVARGRSLRDCVIRYALRLTCPNSAGIGKLLESSVHTAFFMSNLPNRKDYFNTEHLAAQLGQEAAADTDAITWHLFMKAIEFLKYLHIEAKYVSPVLCKNGQFVPFTEDEFLETQQQYAAPDVEVSLPWIFDLSRMQMQVVKFKHEVEMEESKHATPMDVELAVQGTKTAEFKSMAAKYSFLQACLDKGIDPRSLSL